MHLQATPTLRQGDGELGQVHHRNDDRRQLARFERQERDAAVGGGWDEEGTRPLYEQAGGGCERVSAEWWACMAAALAAGHPTCVLGERVEAANVRLAKKHGDSYCHCMLVVGFEGALGAPQSSDRRSASTRGDQTPPRLLVKDPCNAERLLEATFAANFGSGAVQPLVRGSGS